MPNFLPQVLPDDEIAEGITSFSWKQSEVFNVAHTQAKGYVKCDGHNIKLIHIFLVGSGGTGKSHLTNMIYNTIPKTLLYHCKDPEKPRVLLLEAAGYQQ